MGFFFFFLLNIEGRWVIMPNGIIEIISIFFFSFRLTRKEQKEEDKKKGQPFLIYRKRERESDGGRLICTGAAEGLRRRDFSDNRSAFTVTSQRQFFAWFRRSTASVLSILSAPLVGFSGSFR